MKDHIQKKEFINQRWVLATLLLVILSACSPQAQRLTTPLVSTSIPESTLSPSTVSEAGFATASTSSEAIESSPTPTSTPAALYPFFSEGSVQAGITSFSFRAKSGALVNFLLYLPSDFDPDVEWPIILYLHGYGGRGSDLDLVMHEPLPGILETNDEFQFIVVAPQLPDGVWTSFLDPVDQLLTYLMEVLPVDFGRIYLTGFSWGSYGAWQYALRSQGLFAAMAPVSGGPSLTPGRTPENICDLRDLPIWVFHSDADRTVPVDIDAAAVSALETCEGDVRFTRFSDLDHIGTALEVYNNEALYQWFLEHWQ
jgi:predicted peptidase